MTFWDFFFIGTGVVCLYFLLRHGVAVRKFVGEVKVELDKCSWPWDPAQSGFKKYKELIESTRGRDHLRRFARGFRHNRATGFLLTWWAH